MRWLRHGHCVQLRHIGRCFERAVAVLDNGLRHPSLAAPPNSSRVDVSDVGVLGVGRVDGEVCQTEDEVEVKRVSLFQADR
jgi:hypothetical protein